MEAPMKPPAPMPPFHWADYLLFGLSMGVSVLVGLYFAIKDRWGKQSSESYFMADRKMNFILVGLSFLATAQTANLFVGVTAEFYYFGITVIWAAIGYLLSAIITAVIVVPKCHMLGYEVTSIYEYFEWRFGVATRFVAAFLYFVMSILFMAVVLYIPSLVMESVSGLNIFLCIFIGAAVCCAYTAFGGMKAVIWVDSIQVLIIVVSMSILGAKGTMDAGGFSAVWEKYAAIGERNNWNDINPDPWNRHTVWNTAFLLGINLAAAFCASQDTMQRFMTVPSMRRSQISVFIGIFVGLGFLAMVLFIGMSAFATFGGNEPSALYDLKPKEIMPYYMMNVLGEWHGVPGLVVAAIYAAALSTVSSGQNAIAAVIIEDVVCPIYRRRAKKEISAKTKNITSLVLGLVVGVVIMAVALAVPNFTSTLLELTLSIQSFISGPLMGLLMVGFFFFWVEEIGAIIGVLCSFVWAVTIFALRITRRTEPIKIGDEFPPLFIRNFSIRVPLPDPTYAPEVYDVSYTWYVAIDIVIVMVVATIVSLFVHCVRRDSLKDMMPEKNLRYTTHDLLVALGCRKPPVKEPASSTMDLTNGHVDHVDMKDVAYVAAVEKYGVDNTAYIKSDPVHLTRM